MKILVFLSVLLSISLQYQAIYACSPAPPFFEVLSPYDDSTMSGQVNSPRIQVPRNAVFVLTLPNSLQNGGTETQVFSYVNREAVTYEVLSEINPQENQYYHSFFEAQSSQQVIKLNKDLNVGDIIYISSNPIDQNNSEIVGAFEVIDTLIEDQQIMALDRFISIKARDTINTDAQTSACDPVDGYLIYRNLDLIYTIPMDIFNQIGFIYYHLLFQNKWISHDYSGDHPYQFKYLDANDMEVSDPSTAQKVVFVLTYPIFLTADPNALIKDYQLSENDQYRCAQSFLILKDGDLIQNQSCISIEEISAMEQMLYATTTTEMGGTQAGGMTGGTMGGSIENAGNSEGGVDQNTTNPSNQTQESSCQSVHGNQALIWLLLLSCINMIYRRKLSLK